MHPQAQRVQQSLIEAGCAATVRELPDSTRTAVEAAQAVGCEVGQIVKSLIFTITPPGKPLLLLVSGNNRVNETAIGAFFQGKISKANAAQVEQSTGFVIGGVPPIGHATQLPTYIDEDLFKFKEIWAAAGTPHAVFPVSPEDLLRITGAEKISVR